ncbi:MAG: hypothetical protein ACJ79C_14695 [Myxococcales bacterium]
MDEELLRKLRESSGLRLDREGRFFHQGTPIEPARTVATLPAGLHRAEDGRWATRIGRDWAYVDVEDAGRFVRRIETAEDRLRAQLATGEWVEIDPATLGAGADDALYVRLPDGERARLTRAAQLSLLPYLEQSRDGFELRLGARAFPIGRDEGREQVRPKNM